MYVCAIDRSLMKLKRIISLLLLLTAPVTFVQPVAFMHYCGGRLHSVEWWYGSAEASCCKSAGTATACPQHKDTSPNSDGQAFPQWTKRCCTDFSIRILTDDFQPQQKTKTDACPSVLLFGCVPANDISVHDGRFPVHPSILPPGVARTANLPKRLCVFRI
jgi:hypothetical protein